MELKEESEINLKRTINLWNGISIIIGVIVGSGIFVSPKGVLSEAGSVGTSLLVWVLSGCFTLMGALCFAELGTSVLISGGEYTYIKLAYGPFISFLYLWVQVVVIVPCNTAILALTFSSYVLQPFYSGCEPPDMATKLLALAIIIALVYMNSISVKGTLRLQDSFMLSKFLVIALIVAIGFYYMATGRASSFSSREALWDKSQTNWAHLAQAFYTGYYTFAGWNSLNFVTEEIKNPKKNMPRAIILSIGLITLIYTFVNASYFAVLSKEAILESNAIAVTFGERVLPSFLSWVIPISVALSTMGSLNATIFSTSRMLFAGAREGQLFSALNMISVRYLSPTPSIIFIGLTSSVYLFTAGILSLINYTVFVEATIAALAVSTVLTLRYKMPDTTRPLKVWSIVPVVYLLFTFLLIALPIWNSPTEAIFGISIMLTGVPVFYLTANWKNKPALYQTLLRNFNLIIQKLTQSVIPTSEEEIRW